MRSSLPSPANPFLSNTGGTAFAYLIGGAGDLATGVAVQLYRAGFPVVMTDLPHPTAVRRTVSFCEAIPEETAVVESVCARRAESCEGRLKDHPAGRCGGAGGPGRPLPGSAWKAAAVVDAILAKRNTGTNIGDAKIVVALGPGFTAGVDCHAVVETMRGHDLGRVLRVGAARPNTGVPGEIGGHTAERLLRAPADGLFEPVLKIADMVKAGDAVAWVGGAPVTARISGVLRGLLRAGTPVYGGMKSGDIDPRCEISHCFSVSDKARAIGGGVLEAILSLGGLIRGK